MVEFKLPADVKPALVHYLSEGKNVALQTTPDGRAWFIEPHLKRGTHQDVCTFAESVVQNPRARHSGERRGDV